MSQALPTQNPVVPVAPTSSRRNRKIGILLIFLPWSALFLTVLVYAVVSTIVHNAAPSTGGLAADNSRGVIMAAVSALLGFLGLLCVLGIILGIPLGIYFLTKREAPSSEASDPRSGKGKDSVVPEEIQGWNWGAFGLTIIWGLYHRVWLTLLCLIPLLGLPLTVYFGLTGNERAWKKNTWTSVADFQRSQAKWRPWGIAATILLVILYMWQFVSGLSGFAK